jgi:hypothetical protein
MAATHEDKDFNPPDLTPFMSRLKDRADAVLKAERSTITAGLPGERPLAQWEHSGISVRRMSEDEQCILRISIGGGAPEGEPQLDYCVFRGDPHRCLFLMERAVEAMRSKLP